MNSGAYHNNPRSELLHLIPSSTRSLLDVGCGAGATAALIKSKCPQARIVGIESNFEAATAAKQVMNHLIFTDLNDLQLEQIPQGFDVILCADILEHLSDPVRVLKILRQKINPEGRLLLSVPNIRHWSVLAPLLFEDRFTYADDGLLDRTHCHLFTLQEIVDTINASGFTALSPIESNCVPAPDHLKHLIDYCSSRGQDKEQSQFKIEAFQYLISAAPSELIVSDSVGIQHANFTKAGPQFEDEDPELIQKVQSLEPQSKPLLFAFHLPQFHTIPENDAAWGKGFTEWRQLARSIPRFPDHYQPRIPLDLGFYNLSQSEDLIRQHQLAQSHGIDAFCYYYYSFNQGRVLEKPIESHLDSDSPMQFFLMWANEDWTRTWDGIGSDVLLKQDYGKAAEQDRLSDWLRHFKDPRYLQIDNRPLLLIYTAHSIPDCSIRLDSWRYYFRKNGFNPLIFAAQTINFPNPCDLGFDGAIEFPPNYFNKHCMHWFPLNAYDDQFKGTFSKYSDYAEFSLHKKDEMPLIKTIIPSWDNDARRPNRSHIIAGSTPILYQQWLTSLLRRSYQQKIFGRSIVGINAWNEWAEAAYLEPDVYYGRAYLNATSRAILDSNQQT